MWEALCRRVARVTNPWIRALLERVLSERESTLRVCPAAVTVHHAYPGGLLEHILSLATLGEGVASHYGVDPDLLLAGAVLHDIGKLDELSHGDAITYTRDGNLVGHIGLGLILVRGAIRSLPGFPDELRGRIEHMVVSHHGSRHLGSPVEPMTEEAFILSALDDLDARLHQVRRHQQEAEGEGEFTAFHPRLRRVLLKPSGR